MDVVWNTEQAANYNFKKENNRNSDNEHAWYYAIIYLHFIDVKLAYNAYNFCYTTK